MPSGAMPPTTPRAPLTPAAPVFGSAPTREVQVSSAPGSLPAVTELEHPLPEDLGPVRIEDTPIWSEPLRSDEDLSAIEPSRDSRPAPPLPFESGAPEEAAWESQPGWDAAGADAGSEDEGELPVSTGELLGDEVDVGLADTNPRIQRPQPGHEDTQPRVVLQDVYRQDTQPRVVLDESLTRDSDEEVSQGGKTRRPRRRVTSTGTPVVSPRPTTSTSRMAAVNARNQEEREAENHRRDEAEPPVPQEITRRTAVPKRPSSWKWLVVTLVLLLLVGGGLSAAAFLQMPHEQEQVEPPPARPLFPGKKAAQAPAPSAPSPAPAAGESAAVADSTPTASANTESPGTAEPVPVPAGSAPAAAPAEALAAAPNAAPAGDTGTPSGEMSPEEALLAPLAAPASATVSTPSKRQVQRKRTSSRTQSMLQKEWVRTRVAYKSLTRIYACENLDLLCSRYENLESEVVGMGDGESAELLGKVRALQREIQRRKKGS